MRDRPHPLKNESFAVGVGLGEFANRQTHTKSSPYANKQIINCKDKVRKGLNTE
jgi:hypothetical protein